MDDFGGKLRQARERRGISLRQIAAATKIAPAALEALERNDVSKLPGGIFSRAFVRSYAAEVGLDPEDTVRDFLDRFNQEPAPTADSVAAAVPEAEAAFENRRRMAALGVKIAVAAVPVLIAILYFTLRVRTSAQAPMVPSPVSTPAAPAPPTAVAAAPPADAASDTAPAGEPIVLELLPQAECWISATVDGRPVFMRVMQPGEREALRVLREAVVEVGDAGAFAFKVNGREGKALGDAGQKRTLRLTPETVSQLVR